MPSSQKTIFLTGISGTLGKEILKYLAADTDSRLYLLLRRKNRYSHWDRVRKMLAAWGLDVYLGTRIHVLEGDVTLPRFGLSEDDVEILKNEVTDFFHIAALTALNGSEEDCFQINLGGTLHALELANQFWKEGKLQHFFYFSTAYVAGSLKKYCSKEDELPNEPAHANFYESSKFKAETQVRAAIKDGLPATIFRPSIVVGNSQTGEVSQFNVIYPFIRLFAHGILKTLPTNPENSFNIVPIDFVVEASMAISQQPDIIGKTFHLVSEEPPTIGMLLRLKQEEYPNLPEVELRTPESFQKDKLDPTEQLVYEMLHPYLGYLNGQLTFDATNTKQALKSTHLELPKTDYTFLKTLLKYAVDSGYLLVPQN